MTTVHKFPLHSDFTRTTVYHGKSAKFLHFDFQDNIPMIWMEVDTAEEISHSTEYKIVGTGQKVPPDSEHIKTTVCGSYVWHLYKYK